MSEPAFRLPSYRPCEYCKDDCPLSTEAEPCWGKVTADTTDDGDMLHTCRGHSYCLAVPYWPSTEPEDLVRKES